MSGKNDTLLALAVAALLCVGLASSIYLTHLYVQVHRPGANAVDSFCALSEKVNCVTVSNSSYSTVLGIPVSVYGLEYFTFALLLLVLGRVRSFPLRQWHSYLFLCSAASIPFCIALGYIATFVIRSVCILCLTVYVVNIATTLLLGLLSPHRLRELVTDGPAELWRWAVTTTTGKVAVPVILVAALSQFVWMPALFSHPEPATGQPPKVAGDIDPFEGCGLNLGQEGAPLHIQEFTDYQCPMCGMAHGIISELLASYPGKVYYEHHDFPLDMACNPLIKRDFHPNACRAALYGRCAAAQHKFCPMAGQMFSSRNDLSEEKLQRIAAGLDLNMPELARCLDDPATLAALKKDIEEGMSRGVNGTPTFFINGQKVVGVKPLGYFETLLKQLATPVNQGNTP